MRSILFSANELSRASRGYSASRCKKTAEPSRFFVFGASSGARFRQCGLGRLGFQHGLRYRFLLCAGLGHRGLGRLAPGQKWRSTVRHRNRSARRGLWLNLKTIPRAQFVQGICCGLTRCRDGLSWSLENTKVTIILQKKQKWTNNYIQPRQLRWSL